MSQKQEIKITCKGADLLPFDSLENFQGNLKKITKQNLDKLKKRIIRDGINVPLFVWRENDWCRILDGHQRLKALQSLREDGYIIPMIPVCYIEAEDEKDARQKLLGITSQFGEFEMEELSEWLAELDADVKDTVRLADAGLKLEPDPVEIKEDEAPEAPEKPVTVRGDVYTLGNHRIMCGDSTMIDDVEKLMRGDKIDLYLTDPPYNVNYQGGTKDLLKIQNDSMDDDKFREFLKDAFLCANLNMKRGAVFYIWHADLEGYNFRGACFDIGWKIRQCLIWNKNTMVMGRQDYHWKHEPCLYGWKDGSTHLWEADRKQTTVIDFKKPTKSTVHPTMKPVELFTYLIRNNTKNEYLVYDSFLGSGTTLIACEQTNRICYGMELDEKYCDVIVQRWVNLTGGKVIKNGKEIDWNAN